MESFVLAYIILMFVVAWVWRERGHSFVTGLVLSFLFSPVVGLLIGLVKRQPRAAPEVPEVQAGSTKKCPYCAELIKAEACVPKSIHSGSRPSSR